MYIVRFTTREGTTEDYCYHNRTDAVYHLHCFTEDDSGLHESIVVINEAENMTTEEVLYFGKDGVNEDFHVGDVVRYNHAFCTEGEQKYIFSIRSLDERFGGRAVIVCLNSQLTLSPSEMVDLEMIHGLGMNVDELLRDEAVRSLEEAYPAETFFCELPPKEITVGGVVYERFFCDGDCVNPNNRGTVRKSHIYKAKGRSPWSEVEITVERSPLGLDGWKYEYRKPLYNDDRDAWVTTFNR